MSCGGGCWENIRSHMWWGLHRKKGRKKRKGGRGRWFLLAGRGAHLGGGGQFNVNGKNWGRKAPGLFPCGGAARKRKHLKTRLFL